MMFDIAHGIHYRICTVLHSVNTMGIDGDGEEKNPSVISDVGEGEDLKIK